MPTFGISRKISLSKFNCPYETIDLTVEGCQSWEEAEAEIRREMEKIHLLFQPSMVKRLKMLNEKARLTISEEKEREEIILASKLNLF